MSLTLERITRGCFVSTVFLNWLNGSRVKVKGEVEGVPRSRCVLWTAPLIACPSLSLPWRGKEANGCQGE